MEALTPQDPPAPDQTSQVKPEPSMARNAVKLVGEAILPGASLLIDGKILHGGAHLLASAVARACLGPLGVVLVMANSYSSSTTGKNLLKHLTRDTPPKPE
jgi:hypothetical protein